MNDNDIIRALEYIADTEDYELEDYPDVRAYNAVKVINLAINLINRQQAEIERLKLKLEVTQEAKEQLEKDVFNEEMNLDGLAEQLIKTAKSAARKEFAERLINEKSWQGMWEVSAHVDVDDIDNLLAEMEKENGNESLLYSELITGGKNE